MKDYRVYRCKRCGQEITACHIEAYKTVQLKRILSAENDTIFIGNFIGGTEAVHHCENNSIGICELIGWGAEE